MMNLQEISNILNTIHKFLSNSIDKKSFAKFCEMHTGLTNICTGCGSSQINSCADLLMRKSLDKLYNYNESLFPKLRDSSIELLRKLYTRGDEVANEIQKRDISYIARIKSTITAGKRVNITRLKISESDYDQLILNLKELLESRHNLLQMTPDQLKPLDSPSTTTISQNSDDSLGAVSSNSSIGESTTNFAPTKKPRKSTKTK